MGGPTTSSAQPLAVEAGFQGAWQDDEGSVVTFQDGRLYGPEGATLPVVFSSPTECSLMMDDEPVFGRLDNLGQIVWSDGCVWVRPPNWKVESPAPPAPSRASPTVASWAVPPIAKEKDPDDDLEQTNSPGRRYHDATHEGAGKQGPTVRGTHNSLGGSSDEDGDGKEEAGSVEGEEDDEDESSEDDDDDDDETSIVYSDPDLAPPRGPTAQRWARRSKRNDRSRDAKKIPDEDRGAPESLGFRQSNLFDRSSRPEVGKTPEVRGHQPTALSQTARAPAAAAPPASGDAEYEAAKARSEAGAERARQAFLAERAKRAAALERVRAAAKGAPTDGRPMPGQRQAPHPNVKIAYEPTSMRLVEEDEGHQQRQQRQQQEPQQQQQQQQQARTTTAAEPDVEDEALRSREAARQAALERARARAAERATRTQTAARSQASPTSPAAAQTASAPGSLGAAAKDRAARTGVQPGVIVRATGLKSRADLNGLTGLVIALDAEKGRWQVRFEAFGDLLLKEENLLPLGPQETDEMDDAQDKTDEGARVQARPWHSQSQPQVEEQPQRRNWRTQLQERRRSDQKISGADEVPAEPRSADTNAEPAGASSNPAATSQETNRMAERKAALERAKARAAERAQRAVQQRQLQQKRIEQQQEERRQQEQQPPEEEQQKRPTQQRQLGSNRSSQGLGFGRTGLRSQVLPKPTQGLGARKFGNPRDDLLGTRGQQDRAGSKFGAYHGMDEVEFDDVVLPGVLVRILGLKARSELNGLVGLAVTFDERKQRWQVRFEEFGDLLLKEENLLPLAPDEVEELHQHADKEEIKVEQEAKVIKTRATGEKMRWFDDDKMGPIVRGPSASGNDFDVLMVDERDGVEAADKIIDVLGRQGVCLCEANCPPDLLANALGEATALYEGGHFGPPMRACDEDTEFEAQVWKGVLYQDEERVLWINPEEQEPRVFKKMKALNSLSENMLEFCRGLGASLERKLGVNFTHLWNGMLSCYTGDRKYAVHLDNPHLCGGAGVGEHRMPDNGLRLTLVYYINTGWDPDTRYNGGGMDVFLTDPKSAPSSASAARQSKRLRIAPHADTLAIFLSERTAHQVIDTRGKDKVFCLTMWCFDQDVMMQFLPKISEIRQSTWQSRYQDEDSGSDLD